MSTIDPDARKSIVTSLHAAIDHEMCDDVDTAYSHYIDSVGLVVDVLRKDLISGQPPLTPKDKWCLVAFARQSIDRVSLILRNRGGASSLTVRDGLASRECFIKPSAPSPEAVGLGRPEFQSFDLNGCGPDVDERAFMARYQRRINMASTLVERQNLELELARQLVEKAAITRNRLMQATAWAFQTSYRKFKIQEKLQGGKLKEADFKKQQLYALSLQFNEGNVWLRQLAQDLVVFPNNNKLVRELLSNTLTDSAHPIRATMIQMQLKIQQLVESSNPNTSNQVQMAHFNDVSQVIKDDLSILLDVLLALYEPLDTEKNKTITSDALYHVYFAPLKQPLISLIRLGMKETEEKLLLTLEEHRCSRVNKEEEKEDESALKKKEISTKLHYLLTLHNPHEMIDCVVHIIKLLATTKFDEEHSTSMGADDLLPKLCQAVISSRIPTLYAEAVFMETFMPTEKAIREEGYAVTMLQSVISHLVSCENED